MRAAVRFLVSSYVLIGTFFGVWFTMLNWPRHSLPNVPDIDVKNFGLGILLSWFFGTWLQIGFASLGVGAFYAGSSLYHEPSCRTVRNYAVFVLCAVPTAIFAIILVGVVVFQH